MMRARGASLHELVMVPTLEKALDHLIGKRQIFVVVRGRPRWLKLHCPCGCGSVVAVNLDARVGRSWRLAIREGRATLAPSVWRTSGCKSHFLLINNRTILVEKGRAPRFRD
jgi:hypothetical protein